MGENTLPMKGNVHMYIITIYIPDSLPYMSLHMYTYTHIIYSKNTYIIWNLYHIQELDISKKLNGIVYVVKL